jgi:hypothetical protein
VHETVALAEEDLRRLLRQMSADVQASLALSRAALEAVANLSPALGEATELALEQQLDAARESSAPQRTIDHIECAWERLRAIPARFEMTAAMARALVTAADALPDHADPPALGARA